MIQAISSWVPLTPEKYALEVVSLPPLSAPASVRAFYSLQRLTFSSKGGETGMVYALIPYRLILCFLLKINL